MHVFLFFVGLVTYVILYRKKINSRTFQYTLAQESDESKNFEVQIDGTTEENLDPFKGLFEVDLKLDRSQSRIIGVDIDGKCVVKA